MPPFRRNLVAVALVMAGCATIPETDPAIENARAALEAARNDPQVVALAPLELRQADDAFQVAVAAWRSYGSRTEIDHLSYLAFQHARIARAAARLKAAQASGTTAVADPDRTHLDARTRVLEVRLVDLQAKNTDRGIVITLGDVLFETGSAKLNPGGVRVVHELADFLAQYPNRRVAIEGYTDSVGGEGYNQDLSERRANAVRIALLDLGVGVDRMTARGFGTSYPIADNASATGRQLNRRVEILISDENGRLRPRAS
jgi:outer membrane protein OmpA-like peptidoglycan-associated protein